MPLHDPKLPEVIKLKAVVESEPSPPWHEPQFDLSRGHRWVLKLTVVPEGGTGGAGGAGGGGGGGGGGT